MIEFPAPPAGHAIAVMVLSIVAFGLFTRKSVPVATTSLLIILALTLGFHLFPYARDGRVLKSPEFFLGFGNEALITVCALMILGRGLVRTGALEPLARTLARQWASHPSRSMLFMVLICVVFSAFINDTPVVVLMLPILIGIALRTGTPPSNTLMPMNFAVLMGGMGTAIGTSTNVLVVSVAASLGVPRFGMFGFTPIAAIAAVGGVAYLWLIAPRLLPDRPARLAETSPRIFKAILHIGDESYANGKSLAEVLNKTGRRMSVTRIQRGEELTVVRLPTAILRSGDRLLVSDTPENLKEYEQLLGATLHGAEGGRAVSEDHPLACADQQLAEIVVTDGSPLHGRTLTQVRFVRNYRLVPLGIHRTSRRSRPPDVRVEETRLEVGDVLLVQGSKSRIKALKRDVDLLVLDATMDLPYTRKAPLALIIMVAVVVPAAAQLLPISISALLGTALMLLSGCLSWRDIGRALSPAVILLIVASLALGLALMRTGATDYLAQLVVWATAGMSPQVIVSTLILLMAVLANFVSHNAAAVIGTPIAVSIAQKLHVPAEPFVLAILFGANLGFATPMGYQTNLIVMNAGGYSFADFLRVGVPLVIMMWLAFSWLLPLFYPM